MRRLLLLCFGVLLTLILTPVVSAQASIGFGPFTPGEDPISQDVEHISTYAEDIVIRTDGTIGVTERILYNFSSPRHGIIRQIPFIKTNSDGKTYRMTVTDIGVVDDQNVAYQFTQSTDANSITLKVGNPDVTITGTHWYDISYTVRGALTYFSDHDELYWNAVGTEWQVPVGVAHGTVSLPGKINPADIRVTCFTGAAGSRESSCEGGAAGNTVSFKTTKQLAENNGLTIVVGFPKNLVAVLEPTQVVPFFSTVAGKIVLALICILAILWYVGLPIYIARHWWTAGRDPKPLMGEVKAWFSPPKTEKGRDLTPAETGSLIDETVDMRDIYATIVDLARRGFVKIIEVKNGAFDLLKVKKWDDTVVLPYERELLDGIFDGDDQVTLKDLDLKSTVDTVSNELYTWLVTDGFFPKNPKTLRTLYGILAAFAFITVNPLLVIVSLTFGLHMPRKTLFGAGQAAVARSLKNFLTSQDKQLAFQAKNQMMFEKLLPYAIAFGVEVVWAKRFRDLVLKKPDWYQSSTGGAFNSIIFAQALGRGYSTSFVSAATYKSSSGFSSGFGGGGFSGGGGGGGGGGSW